MSKYQDFVIKDGTFVGMFEEMYQKFDDPWIQSEIDHSVSRQMSVLNLQRYKISSVIEYGCGLGYFSQMIQKSTNAKVIGVDISETAISKARSMFPNIDFRVGDVNDVAQLAGEKIDCILFAEITWYVLPQLKEFFNCILENFSGKYFFHNLVFYQNSVQQYGVEYFKNLEQFIDFCPLKLLETTVRTPRDVTATIETHSVFEITRK
jgi:SAM-dependent methyltransferase